VKKTIYLHIGFGKTGTTSIQQMYYESRNKLLQNKILYPQVGLLQYGHHMLAKLGQESMSNEVQDRYLELLKEIEENQPKTIILSSENFIFMKPQYIQEISELLKNFDVKIIFYIRKQTSLIESTYMEWLKTGKSQYPSIEEFYNIHKQSFDFLQKIQPWIDYFGKEQIISRLFDKKIIGNNVCTDILNITDIDPSIANLDNYSNQSLPNMFVDLVHSIDKSNISSKQREEIITELLNLSSLCKVKSDLFTLEQQNEIKYQYQASNDKFSDAFLSNFEKEILLS